LIELIIIIIITRKKKIFPIQSYKQTRRPNIPELQRCLYFYIYDPNIYEIHKISFSPFVKLIELFGNFKILEIEVNMQGQGLLSSGVMCLLVLFLPISKQS